MVHLDKLDYYKYIKRYVLDYCEIINQISSEFSLDSAYWFTPLSCRDRFGSQLQEYYNFLIGFNLNKDSANKDFRLNQKFFIYFFKKYSEYKKTFTFAERSKFGLLFLFQKIKNFIWFLKLNGRLYKSWFFSQSLDYQKLFRNVEIFFISPQHVDKEIIPNKHNDVYFGELVNEFSERGYNVALLGPVVATGKTLKSVLSTSNTYPITNFNNILKLKDVLKLNYLFILTFLKPPRINRPLNSALPGIKEFLNFELNNSVYYRLIGIQISYLFRKILENNSKAKVLHTYENIFWERAIDIPMYQLNRRDDLYGYVHSAILESHLTYYTDSIDFHRRPMPSRILCTGKNAVRKLKSLGQYPNSMLVSTSAIRGTNLPNLPLVNKKISNIKTVLVLLEGVAEMLSFVKVILIVSKMNPSLKFRIRSHPIMPLSHKVFESIRNEFLISEIEESKGFSLEDDLSRSDVVVYKGTTAVFTAAYMGIPIIHYKDNWWLNDDPLSDIKFLKQSFSRPEEFLTKVNYFKKLDQLNVKKQRKNLRDYLDNYLSPFSMKEFEDTLGKIN